MRNDNAGNDYPVIIETKTPSSRRYLPKRATLLQTADSAISTIGRFADATNNYAESLRISSKVSLIHAHEDLQETVRNSTLSPGLLRDILGDDYDNYR